MLIFFMELALHLSEAKDVNALLGRNIERHAACRISTSLLFNPGVRALVTSRSNLATFAACNERRLQTSYISSHEKIYSNGIPLNQPLFSAIVIFPL